MLGGHGLVEVIKSQRVQSVKGCISDGLNGGRARQRFQDAHLAEKISWRQLCQFDLTWLTEVFTDSDLSFANDEEPVSSFSFTYDDFARRSFDFFGALPEQIQRGFVKACEDRHVLQWSGHGSTLGNPAHRGERNRVTANLWRRILALNYVSRPASHEPGETCRCQ